MCGTRPTTGPRRSSPGRPRRPRARTGPAGRAENSSRRCIANTASARRSGGPRRRARSARPGNAPRSRPQDDPPTDGAAHVRPGHLGERGHGTGHHERGGAAQAQQVARERGGARTRGSPAARASPRPRWRRATSGPASRASRSPGRSGPPRPRTRSRVHSMRTGGRIANSATANATVTTVGVQAQRERPQHEVRDHAQAQRGREQSQLRSSGRPHERLPLPSTAIESVRLLGPSSSTRSSRCQRPSCNAPPETWTVWPLPSSEAPAVGRAVGALVLEHAAAARESRRGRHGPSAGQRRSSSRSKSPRRSWLVLVHHHGGRRVVRLDGDEALADARPADALGDQRSVTSMNCRRDCVRRTTASRKVAKTASATRYPCSSWVPWAPLALGRRDCRQPQRGCASATGCA